MVRSPVRLMKLACRRCRYSSAALDLQAAQEMYAAMGQQAKANSLLADIQKFQGMQYRL